MKSNKITFAFLAFIGILGWNSFLAKRDDKLFKAYDYQKAKVEFCSSQAGWHPDCNDDKIYQRYYEKAAKEGVSNLHK